MNRSFFYRPPARALGEVEAESEDDEDDDDDCKKGSMDEVWNLETRFTTNLRTVV